MRIPAIAICALLINIGVLQADDVLTIKHVSPRALQPGNTVRIEVSGPRMETAGGLWPAS